MLSFNTVILRMKERSGMWIGSPSITMLNMFLQGYETALQDLQIESQEVKNFRKFHYYIFKHYNYAYFNKGWCNMILENSLNEADALSKFFPLFESFLQEQNQNSQPEEAKE